MFFYIKDITKLQYIQYNEKNLKSVYCSKVQTVQVEDDLNTYIAEKMDFDLKCSKTSLKEEKSFNLKVAVSQDFWHFFYETNPQGAPDKQAKMVC